MSFINSLIFIQDNPCLPLTGPTLIWLSAFFIIFLNVTEQDPLPFIRHLVNQIFLLVIVLLLSSLSLECLTQLQTSLIINTLLASLVIHLWPYIHHYQLSPQKQKLSRYLCSILFFICIIICASFLISLFV